MNLTNTDPVKSDTPQNLQLFNAFSIGEKGAPSLLFGSRGLRKTDPIKRYGAGEYVVTLSDTVRAGLDVHIFTAGPSKAALRAKVLSTPAQMAEGKIAFVMLDGVNTITEIPAGETLHVNAIVCNSTSLVINKPPVAALPAQGKQQALTAA